MSLHPTLYILLATLLLGGCDQQTAAVASAPAPVSTSSNADAGSGASVGQDGIPQLQREALLPLAAYIAGPASPQEPNAEETRISEHFRQMYWSAAKRDDTLLAVDFIAGFPKVQDSFQRTDLIRSNRALLDAAFADARANKHFSIYYRKAAPLQLQHYDDKEKGFPFQLDWSEDRELYFAKPNTPGIQRDSWRLLVLGGSVPASQAAQSTIFRPPSEDAARHIESRLAKVANPDGKALSLPVILLGHTVAAHVHQFEYRVVFVVDAVVALDPTDRTPLFTLDATHLGRSFPIRSKETAELLGAPYPQTTHARFM